MNLQMTTPTEVAMQSKNNELANVASLLENLQQLSMNNSSSSIAAAPCPCERFWLIDETLSANLVYQSDYEIGSTILSGRAMVKIMM